MRTPVAMIQSDSSVNRISVSQSSGLVAIPFDNRNVRIYDLSGNRIARLPRWVGDQKLHLQVGRLNCSL